MTTGKTKRSIRTRNQTSFRWVLTVARPPTVLSLAGDGDGRAILFSLRPRLSSTPCLSAGLRTLANSIGCFGLPSPIVIALNYVVVARLLNRTQIHVGADGLRIRVLPIPWWTNQRLPSERIISIGTESRPTAFNLGALTAFEVIARTQQGPVRLFRYTDVDSVAVDNLAKRMQGALDRDEARPVETATE